MPQVIYTEESKPDLVRFANFLVANEAWLKQQLDQKLIEHKNHEKKGLLGRLFG